MCQVGYCIRFFRLYNNDCVNNVSQGVTFLRHKKIVVKGTDDTHMFIFYEYLVQFGADVSFKRVIVH